MKDNNKFQQVTAYTDETPVIASNSTIIIDNNKQKGNDIEDSLLKAKAPINWQKYYAVTVNSKEELNCVVAWLNIFNPTHMLCLNGGQLGIGDAYGVHISLTASYLSKNCNEESANGFGCTIIPFSKFKELCDQLSRSENTALKLEVEKYKEALEWLYSHTPDLHGEEIENDFIKAIKNAEQALKEK